MLTLFVGSLNRPAPYFAAANGAGILALAVDEETLSATPICEATDIDNPTFLALDAGGTRLYATSEVFGWKEGVVSAYAYDAGNRSLTYLNKQPTLGSIAAYVSIDAGGRHVYVANYGMGEGGPDRALAVFPIAADGALRPALASVGLDGAGPTARQERSHAHCAKQLPDGSTLVADLGTDKVHRYRLDGEHLAEIGRLDMPAGAGPRHIALSTDGAVAYMLNELDSTVTVADLSTMSLGPTTRLFADGPPHDTISADIHLSPDGRFLYASSRGADTLSVLRVDRQAGSVELIDQVPTGGRTPRSFALTPSARHVFVANQDSDAITIFSRDAEKGTLADTGRRIETGTPMCVKFL